MHKWLATTLKLFWGAYLALTSLYCLLAFLPYTYFALIKAPPYAWMPWFVRHHALLFWMAWLAALAAYRGCKNTAAYFASFGILACLGFLLPFRPFLATVENNQTAYWGSLVPLWTIVLVASLCRRPSATDADREPRLDSLLSYTTGVFLAAGIALTAMVGAGIKAYSDTRTLQLHVGDLYVTFWSLLSHVLVAVVLISVLNVVRIAASKTANPRRVRRGLQDLLIFGFLWALSARFLESGLSFSGWQAQVYAASLAAALTLLGFSMAEPFLAIERPSVAPRSAWRRTLFIAAVVLLTLVALILPAVVGGGDWNGFYIGTFTLLFWIALSFCIFRLLAKPAAYSLTTIAAILILSLFSYKALGATKILWSKPLGATDDDIERSLEDHAARDESFNLAYRLLGNGRSEACGDLCRILREYTEIRGAQARVDLELVDPLVPTRGERPNIFFFVIDSMRPDYLGSYNPKAAFTPNLDALARDSVVVRNVYTPYAGTSLSEPAIWAGALLLHAHFMQPFARVNSLEKLAHTDGYQMVVSYDEILREILSPADNLVKLDTDKKLWNQLEVCSTIQQTENFLDHRSDTAPVFFYAQPKNVHQFARNDLPHSRAANWPVQPGFNYRISFEVHQVDECMGGFVAYLRARGLYDNSLIIVTSDHGDATGEFGRTSHSVVIYPEVMRVPLIIHLPKAMQNHFVHDDQRVSALIDIAPSLYYLLGHRPIISNPLFGHPLLMETQQQLHAYHRDDLFMASDVRAVYGILADNGTHFYATYDSPPQSYLYDLVQDPTGQHDILTADLKKRYDEQIIDHLQQIADFYQFKPGIGSLLSSAH